MDARYNEIKKMREIGMTLDEIGLHFCVTGQRIRQICLTQERKSKYESCGLEARTYHALERAMKITCEKFPECGLPETVPDGNALKEELTAYLVSGKPLLTRQFGNKTRANAERFLGMKLEQIGATLRRMNDT